MISFKLSLFFQFFLIYLLLLIVYLGRLVMLLVLESEFNERIELGALFLDCKLPYFIVIAHMDVEVLPSHFQFFEVEFN